MVWEAKAMVNVLINKLDACFFLKFAS